MTVMNDHTSTLVIGQIVNCTITQVHVDGVGETFARFLEELYALLYCSPVLTSLMKDADSVRAAVLIPFKLVKTFAFRPKMNLMKKFWTFSCRTKYIHSLLIGPKP